MKKDRIEFTIISKNQIPFKEYLVDNDTCIKGKENEEFRIQIANKSHRKILCIITINQVNTITLKESLIGYTIKPFTISNVNEWYKSKKKFLFSKCDIIECRVFYEKQKAFDRTKPDLKFEITNGENR